MESNKKGQKWESSVCLEKTHLFIFKCSDLTVFFPVFWAASAWRSYRVQIGWLITASPSWWRPRDFLLTSVTSVRTHASTPRWGHNETIWPQANIMSGPFMLAAIRRPFSCLLTPSSQADQASGFHIRSVLCVPIWNRTHQIIGKWPGKTANRLRIQIQRRPCAFSQGVAQILNRLDRKTFNDADQRLFEVRSSNLSYTFH